MYCTNCGAERAANAMVCGKCGQGVQAFPPPAAVPNYLVQSILLTFCCCPPIGIVALVFAAQVNSKLAEGDVSGAQRSSSRAYRWCWVAFISGILFAGAMVALSFLKD